MRFRKILCPIDFSEGSRAALEAAVELAKDNGATVTLAHVYEMPAVASYVARAGDYYDLRGSVGNEVQRQLTQWRQAALDLGARSVDTWKAEGAPWHKIVELAADDQSDLIVIATHGLTGVKRMLLGSVAEMVIRNAPCPVFVVRRKAAS
jgi:nucleotide-binding universal stress UspA family protein